MLNALTTKAYIKATEAFRSFKNNEAGVTAIEYGLIAVAVAAMIVVVFYGDSGFITALKNKFSDLTGTMNAKGVK
jgi:conserved domain protein